MGPLFAASNCVLHSQCDETLSVRRTEVDVIRRGVDEPTTRASFFDCGIGDFHRLRFAWWALPDSNREPTDYESAALTD
jgi:hypothetical protein